MHLSKNTSEPSESARGRMSLGSTMPFLRRPRMPGAGQASSPPACGLCGDRMVRRRSGGGSDSCCSTRRSEPANSPRRRSAEQPMSSPDSARRAGSPRASRTSRSLAVRKERVWRAHEEAGRAGDVSLPGRSDSMERADSTRAAARYCPLVSVACTAASSSWLELDVPLRLNVLLDTKLRSLYCAVLMLDSVVVSVDSALVCARTLVLVLVLALSAVTTRAFSELKAASFMRRLRLSSSSSSILPNLSDTTNDTYTQFNTPFFIYSIYLLPYNLSITIYFKHNTLKEHGTVFITLGPPTTRRSLLTLRSTCNKMCALSNTLRYW